MVKYILEQEAFWARHKESRDAIDKDFASRPLTEQLVITAKMRACHEAMRKAKEIQPSEG